MNVLKTKEAMIAHSDAPTMNYDALCEVRDNLQKKIEELNSIIKMQEEIAALNHEYMSKMAELNACLGDNPLCYTDIPIAIANIEDITSADEVENNQNEVNETQTLPETQTAKEDTISSKEDTVPIKKEKKNNVVAKKRVFDNPAFKEPYNPVVVKSTAPETDEKIRSMKEILSEGTETKKEPTKCGRKKALSMKDLLAGEPIDRILCVGNYKDRETDFSQHTRICLAEGICPTLTATGNTTYVNIN